MYEPPSPSSRYSLILNPQDRGVIYERPLRIFGDFKREIIFNSVFYQQDGFAQRKEERFVDYYRVPRNKPLKDGQFLSHGIHLVIKTTAFVNQLVKKTFFNQLYF